MGFLDHVIVALGTLAISVAVYRWDDVFDWVVNGVRHLKRTYTGTAGRETSQQDLELLEHEVRQIAEMENALDNGAVNPVDELMDESDGAVEVPARNARQALQDHMAEQPARRVPQWRTREISEQKAQSIARKEQRKMYSEYMREQARMEREREELEWKMFGDMILQEREERRQRIAEAAEKSEKRRKKQKEEQIAGQRRRIEKRDALASELRRKGLVSLANDEDRSIASTLDGYIVSNGEFIAQPNMRFVDSVLRALRANNGQILFGDSFSVEF